MADPLFTPALVGAAVSYFFTEVINVAKSAYGHKKKCRILLESVNKLQPHIDGACQHSADWEKAQSDALEEIKGILDKARRFATKGADESKSEWRKRMLIFWRWGELPAELMDVIRRIEEAKQNVILCAAIGTLARFNALEKTKSSKLSNLLLQQTPSGIVGVDIPFNKLKASILASHAKDAASHLGLHGRGGAGKTLLAQMLHNDKDIIEKYGDDSIIWMTVGLDARVSDLYKTMAIFLNDRGFERNYGHRSLEDQRSYLWSAFSKKKVLLILDDVWREKGEQNHPMIYWLNIATAPGSTTLITTRNIVVLSEVYAESEVVLSLSEDDSWKLFCSHAFHSDIPPSSIGEELAKEVCKECKGLPLALKVVGSAMKDKVKKEEWSCALRNLRQSKAILGSTVDDELFGRLRWSYNMLEGDVLKTCFLYFAAFPEDYKIPKTTLFNIWISEGLVAAEDEAQAHMEVLEKRSLIDCSHGGGYVQVHDILRDLALVIIDKAEPGECAYDCFFQAGKVSKSFPTRKSLQTIKRMSVINSSISHSFYNLQAPHLQVCLLSGIIGSSDQISNFFSNSGMTSLMYLDLSQNDFVSEEELPDFSRLNSLTHLYLRGCTSLKQFPEQIWKLNSLLKLDLSGCESLEQLPELIWELKCLTDLYLRGCTSLEQLPEQIWKLNSLMKLDLSRCTSLKQLPDQIWELNCLTHLNLSECTSLEQLPEQIWKLKCLTHLNLSGCTSLKQLPAQIWMFKFLTDLDLSGCESLEQLPEQIWELNCLTDLDLSGCTSLRQLPEQIWRLKCLTELYLSGCTSLEQLPEQIWELNCLTDLDLSGCTSLRQLPEQIWRLKCLTDLDLSGCTSLEQLPEQIWEWNCLTHLNLSGCTSLKQLPAQIWMFKFLTDLDLSGCESLEQLPERIWELNYLTDLDLSRCESLKQLQEQWT